MEVGGLLLPVLRAPAPTRPQALHSAMPGCAGRHALGGPGRGRNIPPRVLTGPGGCRQLLAPPRCPLHFLGAILAGVALCWRR